MNLETNEVQRSLADFVFFVLCFIGAVIGIVGVVVSSLPACVIGFFLLGLGLLYFILKGD